jgi:hypothetical protein
MLLWQVICNYNFSDKTIALDMIVVDGPAAKRTGH